MVSSILGLVVHGGDRCLQLVGAGAALGEGGGDQCGALIDLGPVPAGAVLLGERDQAYTVLRGACGPARVGEQHEREQAGHLWLVRQQAA